MCSVMENNGPCVLVIDDNPAIHQDFKKILAGDDDAAGLAQAAQALFGEDGAATAGPRYRVEFAFQGQEGLAKVVASRDAQRPFVLAFVDMRMPPGWDGVETIRRLWQVDPDLQVVICTAYSDYQWSEITQCLGRTDRLLILKKPFDVVEVHQLAAALTEKHRAQHAARLRLDELGRLVEERTQSLQTSLTQLAHAHKMEAVGQLAAGVAHEINTPLQYVGDNIEFLHTAFGRIVEALEAYRGFAESVRAGSHSPQTIAQLDESIAKARFHALSTEVPEAIRDSRDGVQTMARIVRAMKEFSHPGTADKMPVDLNRAIETTITVARNEWKYVAEVTTEFDPELPLVPCLPGEMNQVFLNILVNAAHAIADVVGDGSGGKGTITFRTRRDGNEVEVAIRDTGAGIPEQHRSRVFDPFYTTKEVGKGTGQGLAIAHTVVVQKHGGKIWFDTALGRGTTVFIRLPLEVESAN